MGVQFEDASSVSSKSGKRNISLSAGSVSGYSDSGTSESAQTVRIGRKIKCLKLRLFGMLFVPFLSLAVLSALLLPTAISEEVATQDATSAADVSQHLSHLISLYATEGRAASALLLLHNGYDVLTTGSAERANINASAALEDLGIVRSAVDHYVDLLLRAIDTAEGVWEGRSSSVAAGRVYGATLRTLEALRYGVDEALGMVQDSSPVSSSPLTGDSRTTGPPDSSIPAELLAAAPATSAKSPASDASRRRGHSAIVVDPVGVVIDGYFELIDDLLALLGSLVYLADSQEVANDFVHSLFTATIMRTSSAMALTGWTALTRGGFTSIEEVERFLRTGGRFDAATDALRQLARQDEEVVSVLDGRDVQKFRSFVLEMRSVLIHGGDGLINATVAAAKGANNATSGASSTGTPVPPGDDGHTRAHAPESSVPVDVNDPSPPGLALDRDTFHYDAYEAAQLSDLSNTVNVQLEEVMLLYFAHAHASIEAHHYKSLWLLLLESGAVLFALIVTVALGLMFSQQIARPFLRQQQMKRALKAKVVAMVEHEESLSRFVSSGLVHLLRKRNFGDVLLGDHVLVSLTIMFSDVWHFTTLSERFSPMETFQLVNSFYSRTADHYRAAGGMIDKYLGDGVLSLFTEVSAAINVANALHDEAEQVSREYRVDRRCGFSYQVGVGIHSGDVVLGTVGSAERMDVTIISDAANTASRVESYTRQYDAPTLISDAARQRLSTDDHVTRHVGNVYPKGKQVCVMLYEPISADTDVAELKREYLPLWTEALDHASSGRIPEAVVTLEKYLEVCGVDTVALKKHTVLVNKLKEPFGGAVGANTSQVSFAGGCRGFVSAPETPPAGGVPGFVNSCSHGTSVGPGRPPLGEGAASGNGSMVVSRRSGAEGDGTDGGTAIAARMSVHTALGAADASVADFDDRGSVAAAGAPNSPPAGGGSKFASVMGSSTHSPVQPASSAASTLRAHVGAVVAAVSLAGRGAQVSPSPPAPPISRAAHSTTASGGRPLTVSVATKMQSPAISATLSTPQQSTPAETAGGTSFASAATAAAVVMNHVPGGGSGEAGGGPNSGASTPPVLGHSSGPQGTQEGIVRTVSDAGHPVVAGGSHVDRTIPSRQHHDSKGGGAVNACAVPGAAGGAAVTEALPHLNSAGSLLGRGTDWGNTVVSGSGRPSALTDADRDGRSRVQSDATHRDGEKNHLGGTHSGAGGAASAQQLAVMSVEEGLTKASLAAAGSFRRLKELKDEHGIDVVTDTKAYSRDAKVRAWNGSQPPESSVGSSSPTAQLVTPGTDGGRDVGGKFASASASPPAMGPSDTFDSRTRFESSTHSVMKDGSSARLLRTQTLAAQCPTSAARVSAQEGVASGAEVPGRRGDALLSSVLESPVTRVGDSLGRLEAAGDVQGVKEAEGGRAVRSSGGLGAPHFLSEDSAPASGSGLGSQRATFGMEGSTDAAPISGALTTSGIKLGSSNVGAQNSLITLGGSAMTSPHLLPADVTPGLAALMQQHNAMASSFQVQQGRSVGSMGSQVHSLNVGGSTLSGRPVAESSEGGRGVDCTVSGPLAKVDGMSDHAARPLSGEGKLTNSQHYSFGGGVGPVSGSGDGSGGSSTHACPRAPSRSRKLSSTPEPVRVVQSSGELKMPSPASTSLTPHRAPVTRVARVADVVHASHTGL